MAKAVAHVKHLSLALIDEVSRLDSRPGATRAVFDAMQRCVGFDTGVLLSFEGAAAITTNKTGAQVERWAARSDTYLRQLSPIRAAAERLGDVVLDCDVLSVRQREALDVYAEYFRAMNITTCLTVFIRHGGVVTQWLSLARCGRGSRFTRRDVEGARGLLPAVSMSARLWPGAEPDADSAAVVRDLMVGGDLSRRELEIVRLICRGLRNREIATLFGTSSNTVRNQVAAIFRKCDVSTRAELVAFASRAV